MKKLDVFENEALFKTFVGKHGLNLFTGAGFSTYAYNEDGDSLPLGGAICQKLCETFSINQTVYPTLGKVCQKIKRTQADAMNILLRDTYKVKRYDDIYNILPKLPIQNIITTNIDDLVERIYSNVSSPKDISDTRIYGEVQKQNTVSLYKLHGSITYPFEENMSFTVEELNSLFITNNRLYQNVTYKLCNCPTLFWGTSLEDGNIIQLLCQSKTDGQNNLPKWVVIYPKDPRREYLVEEYHDRGFNIIVADTKELLEYLSDMPFVAKPASDKYVYTKYRQMFPNNFVCNELKKSSMARPINDFFYGSEPQISDVLSSNVVHTSYFAMLQNAILSNDITLITGIPGCGKSTLLLQLAFDKSISGHKFWFSNMLPSEANRLCKLVEDDPDAIVFFDNLYDNLEAYTILKTHNIKLVVCERAINYEYVKSSLNISSKNIIDVSDLNELDIQNICSAMNKPSKDAIDLFKSKSNVSLLEIVFMAFHSETAIDRIKQYISAVKEFKDEKLSVNLLELYALINYISFCGVPTSMDMLIFYFSNDDVSYQDVYYALGKLNGIIVNDVQCTSQDFVTMRSKLFAEISIRHLPNELMGRVLNKFFDNVSSSAIYRYDIFKKRAYDADITKYAFSKEDGIKFYDKVIALNRSPYVKHQYALFLQRKKDIDAAWKIIDQANTESHGRIFSIANTHAIILFDKNIDIPCVDAEISKLKEILSRSFETLEYCVTKDVKITYHVLIYARHTLKYIERFGLDEYSKEYLLKSKTRTKTILDSNEYMYRSLWRELKNIYDQLVNIESNMHVVV